MRIDKFLWSVRKYKTRSLATDEIRKDKVTINGDISKPSRDVKPGDTIRFRIEGIEYGLKVLDIPKSRVGAKLVPDFIKDITTEEELNKKEFIQLMRSYDRRKGTGRPTKKDRRDLDDFKD